MWETRNTYHHITPNMVLDKQIYLKILIATYIVLHTLSNRTLIHLSEYILCLKLRHSGHKLNLSETDFGSQDIHAMAHDIPGLRTHSY